jgi:hypothetical protein
MIGSASEIESPMALTRYNSAMKPDAEYLKQLLTAFQGAPNPTTDIRELEGGGLSIDDPKFEFHMMLLQDGGFVESESRAGGAFRRVQTGLSVVCHPVAPHGVRAEIRRGYGEQYSTANLKKEPHGCEPQHHSRSCDGDYQGRDRAAHRATYLTLTGSSETPL